jgi:acyl-CoA thioesterase-1
MMKKILILVAVVALLLLVSELVALMRLKSSVSRYADYWRNVPASGEFVFVVLGDSAAQSIGASSPEKGYVGLLADRIGQKTGKKVRIVNLSVSGATVKDVTEIQLPQLGNYRPDLVVAEIGGNDVVRTDLTHFESDFRRLSEGLPKESFVATLPYFGGRIRKNAQAIQASNTVVSLAKENDLNIIDLQAETKARDSIRNYSADWFHPSDTGYQIWADAFWKEIEPRL